MFFPMWKLPKSKRVLFQYSSRQSDIRNGPRLSVYLDEKGKSLAGSHVDSTQIIPTRPNCRLGLGVYNPTTLLVL